MWISGVASVDAIPRCLKVRRGDVRGRLLGELWFTFIHKCNSENFGHFVSLVPHVTRTLFFHRGQVGLM